MDEAQAAEQLELAVAGDQDAWQRLIVHYHGPLRHKLAARMDDAVRRQLDVDDVLQDAYVAAFKALAVPPRERKRPATPNRDRERAAKPNRERKRPAKPNRERKRPAGDVASDAPPAEHAPRGTAVPAGSSPSQGTADTAVPPAEHAPGGTAVPAVSSPSQDTADTAVPPAEHTPGGTAVPAGSSPSQDTADTAVPPIGPPSFDSPAGFYKWLETIAFNRLRDQQRALHRQKRDIARDAADRPDPSTSYPDLLNRVSAGQGTPSRHVAKDEATAAVMSSLARLTDEQRAVVRLRFLEGRSVAEIAAELGKTEDAVHKLSFRGLKNLRRILVSITRYLSHL